VEIVQNICYNNGDQACFSQKKGGILVKGYRSIFALFLVVLAAFLLLLSACGPAQPSGPGTGEEYKDFVAFTNDQFSYTIMYPQDWEYRFVTPCNVLFAKNLEELEEADAQVCLEIVYYSELDPDCKSCESVCEIISKALMARGGRVYDIQDCKCGCDGATLQGIELKAEYMAGDEPVKKWIAIFPYSNDQFMQFSFSASYTQYSAYMKQAQLMQESWQATN
jgi:hypothetical protein